MAGRIDEGGDDLVEAHEINVTPFIDVMLVLLIIFMVAAPLSTVDVHVDLPVVDGQAAAAARQAALPDHQVGPVAQHRQRIRLPRAQLASAVETATQSDKSKRLFLRADQTVPYGELMNVLNMLRAAGYLKIALVGLEGVGGRRTRAAGTDAEAGRARAASGQAAMIPSVDLIEPRRRRLIRWIGAATLISAIHIGGGSFAMLYGMEELVEEAPGAIVVEIAPVATALADRACSICRPASWPTSARRRRRRPTRKIEKVEEEAPKEDLPSPVDPEVALPKPTPVEEKPKEEAKEEPSPQVRRRAGARRRGHQGDGAAAHRCARSSTKSAAPEVGTAASNRAQHRDLAEFRGAAPQSAQALSRRGTHRRTCRASCTCASPWIAAAS